MKTLFLFVDGLGCAPASPDNPVSEAVCPFLFRLIRDHSRPIDACLGVPGLPQSATGQAALFTGRNAAQLMGRHVEGFPGPTLQRLVEEDNIFLALRRLGRRSRFAAAHLADSIEEVRARRRRSVTTTMALTCPEVISLRADMLANQAVCHDITRAVLIPKGYTGPLVTPAAAGEHLAQLALGYDFTLFEFFETDRAGHARDMAAASAVLRTLDAFLAVAVPLCLEMGMLVILTSDHGNIEAARSHGHTFNPVPFAARGPSAAPLREAVESLVDVTPQLLRLFAAEPRPAAAQPAAAAASSPPAATSLR